ncbi:4-(cytidine 5'-diphospho)-2-C-methyl-D-erythritol kinase [Amorphus sp. 3PC139-8]
MGNTVRETARAKVNLALHVVGQREDGYHLLDTLVAFPTVGDEIEVDADQTLSLTIDGPFAGGLPNTADNLVLAAAELIQAEIEAAPGAHIRLVKSLPVTSGIGGGSADAAATLRALARLWDLSDAADSLLPLAAALGADVPMCVRQKPLRAEGVGELLTPLPPFPNAGIVLANPGEPVATPTVFQALASRANPGLPALPDRFAELASLVAYLEETRNDLHDAAVSLAPVIGEVEAALADLPGCRFARMSGSGATCFALFDDAVSAVEAADDLRTRAPQWWIAAATL